MAECPSEEQLAGYVAGICTDEQTATIDAHLSTCTRCGEWVARARAADVGETIPSDQLVETQASAEGAAPETPSPSIPGYELVKEAHRGGQGVVYQAIQKSTKRRVAIKVMHEGPFAGPPDRARFEREVQVLGQLNHPNIVAIHDSGTAAGSFYYVMDYISGRSLDDYVTLTKPSIDDALRLFAKICDAVNAAHLRGVIHRDLKPSNIRIDADGQPHILDFGLAKIATGEVTEGTHPHVMTLTGQFMGSLPWASPEQAEAIPSRIDLRTDVYSLGVILYHMLTGRFPYEVVGNIRDVMDNILKAEPARPSTVRKQINDEVETIVLKCLSKERERRYQSAGELGRDIQHYLTGEPIEAKRDSGWYVLRKLVRRNRGRVASLAMLLLLVCVVGIAVRQARQSHVAEQLAQREARVSRLGAARLQGIPYPVPDELKRAIRELWKLLESGTASREELQALAETHFAFRIQERTIISISDVTSRGISYSPGAPAVPSGWGFVTDLKITLDGVAICQEQLVQPSGVFFGMTLEIPEIRPGRHVLAANARLRFARVWSAKTGENSRRYEHKLMDLPEVLVQPSPFEFTVVEEYPTDYPVALTDSQFEESFQTSSYIVGAVRFPSRETPHDYPALITEIHVPAPPLDVAVRVSTEIPAIEFRNTCYWVIPPNDAGRGGDFLSESGGGAAWGSDEDQRSFYLHLVWSLQDFALRGTYSELVGSEVRVTLRPSHYAARKTFQPPIESFLAVPETTLTTVVRDERTELERAAADLFYGLVGEVILTEDVIERIEADATVDEATRAEALRIAQSRRTAGVAHYQDASACNGIAWKLARKPDLDEENYRRAKRLAEVACKLIPDDGSMQNTLGVAQYRLRAYREALETLLQSDRLNSEGRDGGIPEDVAFIAMSLHQLGRVDEARAALARLRSLMQDERWVEDEEAQGFLREAETLMFGVSASRSASLPTTQPAEGGPNSGKAR